MADALSEFGWGVTRLVASAWRAGADPGATRSLVLAAHILAGHEVMRHLWDEAEPLGDDNMLLLAAEEAEADVHRILVQAAVMARDCASTRERARADLAVDPFAAGAVADCGTALKILEAVQGQARAALGALCQVPGELEETYEVPYALVRGGGKLPHHGHFLTGAA